MLEKTVRYNNDPVTDPRWPIPGNRGPMGLIRVRIIWIGESGGAGGSLRTGNFLRKVNEHRAEMFTVSQKIFGATRTGEKKGEDVLVSLLHVARRAGEHEVVTPVVRALSFARGHVIESDPLFADATTAVRANRPVSIEQPFARVGICVSARRQRSALMSWTLDSLSRTTTRTQASIIE